MPGVVSILLMEQSAPKSTKNENQIEALLWKLSLLFIFDFFQPFLFRC
jgi:hypothetical protein